MSVTAQKRVYYNNDLQEVPSSSPEKKYYSEYEFMEVNQDGYYQHSLYDLNGQLAKQFLTEGSSILSKQFGVFTSYYTNGQIESKGNFIVGKKAGTWKLFYNNGSLKEVGQYENDIKVGTWKRFYKNGQLQYTYTDSYTSESQYVKRVYENAWNTSGQQTLSDQTGTIKYYNEKRKCTEEGELKGGKKEGNWIGIYENGQKYYEEKYEADSLINGISWDKNNQKYEYNTLMIEAYPEIGYRKFDKKFYNKFQAKYLTKNIFNNSYTYAEKLFLVFDINLDGSITNIHFLNPQLPSVNNAAKNTLLELKKWVPAVERGQKVPSTFVLPIELFSSDEY
ncbi:hypothetical protein AVL50_03610 [Flammeovirga sp. SJP92]|nr:hypothetical protein AVL50_03610 [Flammeovirga sp. SJP92]